jgi:hypothetical protein
VINESKRWRVFEYELFVTQTAETNHPFIEEFVTGTVVM